MINDLVQDLVIWIIKYKHKMVDAESNEFVRVNYLLINLPHDFVEWNVSYSIMRLDALKLFLLLGHTYHNTLKVRPLAELDESTRFLCLVLKLRWLGIGNFLAIN